MKVVKGNLIQMAKDGEFDLIVHGCNCFNTMGGGIARQIKEEFPDAWLADAETERGNKSKLGTFTLGLHGRLIIVNAYTQYGFNSGALIEDQFEYAAFEKILNMLATRFGCFRFGLPMIGMGLAGGNKERIMNLLEEFSAKVEARGGSITLVEFER